MILTEVVYMRPNGVIEQIPLEHIKERDCRLVMAPGVEQLEPAPVVPTGPLPAKRRRRGLVRGRGGADREKGRARQHSPPEESFEEYTTSEEEGEVVDMQSNSPNDDNDAPSLQPRRKRERMVKD
ncbi:hypothetical protein CsSME_00024698 [Camellia sinensis var. sinensis]